MVLRSYSNLGPQKSCSIISTRQLKEIPVWKKKKLWHSNSPSGSNKLGKVWLKIKNENLGLMP